MPPDDNIFETHSAVFDALYLYPGHAHVVGKSFTFILSLMANGTPYNGYLAKMNHSFLPQF